MSQWTLPLVARLLSPLWALAFHSVIFHVQKAAAPKEHLALGQINLDIRKQRHAQRKASGSEASPIHSGVADYLPGSYPLHTASPGCTTGCNGQCHPPQLKKSSAAVHHPLRRSSDCDIHLAETTSSVLPRVDVASQTELP